MYRDLDICRRILLFLEKQQFGASFIEVKLDGVGADTLAYHLMLMKQANLIDALNIAKSNENFDWRAKFITWRGHEFLEAARDEARWRQARTQLQACTGGEVFDVLMQVLVEQALQLSQQ